VLRLIAALLVGLTTALAVSSAASAKPKDSHDCSIVKAQGVQGAIRLHVIRLALPRPLSCRKARAARFAWNPDNRRPSDRSVLADPRGWHCRVNSRSTPDAGDICERPGRPNAWGILMGNVDVPTEYVPRVAPTSASAAKLHRCVYVDQRVGGYPSDIWYRDLRVRHVTCRQARRLLLRAETRGLRPVIDEWSCRQTISYGPDNIWFRCRRDEGRGVMRVYVVRGTP